MSELKPCPFCGGAVELVFKMPVFGAGGCEIKCLMCKARVNDFRYTETHIKEHSISTPATIESISGCIERAIKAWNRRASDGNEKESIYR